MEPTIGVLAVIITLELFNLGVSITNARNVGVDPVARSDATAAHERIDEHMVYKPDGGERPKTENSGGD